MSRKKPDPQLPSPSSKFYPLPSLSFTFKDSLVIDRWVGPVVITVVFLILTFWTWGKWPDLLRDFGRELYIPWQINSGKVLYKDIAYRHGPLAPYLNALWFYIFGVSFTTLVYCNLSIIIILISIIFYQFNKACDRTTATIICIVFLCTAAFSQLISMGSFNFVCPYDHSFTHGIFFSFITIFFLSYFLYKPFSVILVLAGLSFGLVFLTKAEVFGPLVPAAIVGMMLIFREKNFKGWIVYRNYSLFIVAMIVPISLFLAYFLLKMPFIQALKGVLGDWNFLYGTHITNIYFFKNSMGTDRPIFNIGLVFLTLFMLTILAWGTLKLDKGDFKSNYDKLTLLTLLLAFLILLSLLNFVTNVPIELLLLNVAYRPLLFINMLSLIIIVYLVYRKVEYIRVEKMAPFIILNVFGMLMLGKIILNCRSWGYGFGLAMTAMMIEVALFVWVIPLLLRKIYTRGSLFRKLSIIGFLLVSIIAVMRSNYHYSKKDYLVGKGADAFLSYGPKYELKGWAVNRAIKLIKNTTSPQDNFTPIPEGLIINYLMRRSSSFRYDGITPGELTSFGETAMLESLKKADSKFILLIHRESSEFGVGYFGSDPRNGKQIMDWIKSNYVCYWKIFNEPLKNGKFGMKMEEKIIK